MKIAILFIVIIISIGFLFSVTSLGEQGFLITLLTAFGIYPCYLKMMDSKWLYIPAETRNLR